jgi:hypothetical protein
MAAAGEFSLAKEQKKRDLATILYQGRTADGTNIVDGGDALYATPEVYAEEAVARLST